MDPAKPNSAKLDLAGLEAQLHSEGFGHTFVWQDGPGAVYADHTHPGQTAHIILEGEMTLTMAGRSGTYGPGERCDVPAGAVHAARMGPAGCRYLIGRKIMAKPTLLVTHPLFESVRRLLAAASFDVDYWSEPGRPPRAEVLRRLADKDAMICLLTEKVDAELLAAAPRLRMVANVAVGFDNLDLDAMTRRGVAASNTPGVLDETTADFAWTLLLAVARRLIEGDALARGGQWKDWNLDQLCGTDVWGKTLGIIGLGRIGSAVARRARGFGMRVVYYNSRRASPEAERALGAEFLEREALLAQSDFVSLHVPLTPETRHLIGPAELRKMKPSAFLINTTRGPVVDEPALVAALEAGTIAGAALDVYEHEPIISAGLRRPNVVLAPHLGSASIETRTKMAMMAAENTVAFFAGRRPPNLLNPQVLEGKSS